MGYWTSFFNICSCVVLGLVIQFVRKLTRQPIEKLKSLEAASVVQKKVKMNLLVTASHIVVVVAYTLVLFLSDNFVKLP
jgi:sterol desaturase/sphingolipid hydroxylase (fatty acid hydroxylase superfamily)